MRPLGEALAAAGFAVHAVRLAGHGTTPDDLARTGWRDWLASAEAGLAALRAEAPLLAANPQGRFIAVDEVAATILWLCSDAAASVTGQAISISGGEI